MRSHLIPVAELTAADTARWKDLAQRAVEPNPFFEPDCVLAAHRNLPDAGGLQLAVAEDDGVWFACMPIGSAQRWSRLNRPALMGRAETTSILVSAPLVDAAGGEAAVAALLGAIRARGKSIGARLLVFDWFPVEGEVAGLVRDAASTLRLAWAELEAWQRPALYRRNDPDDYWLANLSTKTQRKLRHKRRRLADQIGPLEVVDRSGDPAAVDEFLRLEASGWKLTKPDGAAFARTQQTADFFTDLCGRFAASQRLVLLSLESGGHSVAMNCLIRAGDGLFGYRVGHDAAYDRYSPGVQIILAGLEFTARDGKALWLDSCTTPDNRYLGELLPDRRRLTTLAIALHGGVDRGFVRALPALAGAKQAAASARRLAQRALTPNRPTS